MIGSEAAGPTAEFHYGELGPVGATLRLRADRIRHHLRAAAERAAMVGRELIAAKAALGHGRFGEWLTAEFNWSESTAQRYMQVAREFPESPHGAGFALRAMLVLCGNGVPEAARREAIERAAGGEKITPTAAREIKKRHTGVADRLEQAQTAGAGAVGQEELAEGELALHAGQEVDPPDVRSAPPSQPQTPLPDPAVPGSPGGEPVAQSQPCRPGAGHTVGDSGPADLGGALETFLALVPAPATPERNQFARTIGRQPVAQRKDLAALLDRAEKAIAYIRKHLSGTLNTRRRPRRGV